MRTTTRRGWRGPAAILFALMLVAPAAVHAATITYTFEPPAFALGETTPLLARAPNVGDPTFETDFSASNGVFLILSFLPNPPLFSGLSLVEAVQPVVGDLTLVFSRPIFSLQVDFGVNAAQGAPASLQLITPVGATSQAAANVGGTIPGGTLFFASTLGFTTAQLLGFASPTTRTEFAIDNLTLDTAPAIPEPASLILIATGLLGLGLRRSESVRARVRFVATDTKKER